MMHSLILAASCAALLKAFPGPPCSLDAAGFRTEEPLLAVKPHGRSFEVRNAGALKMLRLAPGDTVVLAGGEWRDADLQLHAEGTAANPVTVRAAKDVVLTGRSQAAFTGRYLVVRGLTFRRGAVARDNFVVFRLGNGADDACDHCVADRLTIDGYDSAPSGYDTLKIFYMVLIGKEITVANSFLGNKHNLGTMISHSVPDRFLFLNNKVSGFAAGRAPSKGDRMLMQLGWSEVGPHPSHSVLMGNTFERDVGENETVAVKTSDVVIRDNTFRANVGTLNLRSANRVLVAHNVFDGAGQPGMGGVRIEGGRHWIVNNLFKGLVRPQNYYYWPIAIHVARDEELREGANDYARVKDVVIAGNRFEDDNAPPIAFGIYPDPARGRTLAPQNVYLLDNDFVRSGPAPVFYATPGTVVQRGNRISN
ncbi:MAG TPA: chondroitinase-B domain-containing protein [Rhizomicrobium sp.]|nr:chondroitinase-B domain-containing protein [Rhizomicrobium sp.]